MPPKLRSINQNTQKLFSPIKKIKLNIERLWVLSFKNGETTEKNYNESRNPPILNSRRSSQFRESITTLTEYEKGKIRNRNCLMKSILKTYRIKQLPRCFTYKNCRISLKSGGNLLRSPTSIRFIIHESRWQEVKRPRSKFW